MSIDSRFCCIAIITHGAEEIAIDRLKEQAQNVE